jgi:hypothetical protein
MNQRGTIDFLICKVGVALVVVLLVAAVLGMAGSFSRVATRNELGVIADQIRHTLRIIDGMPGEVQLERELPSVEQMFGITIVGTLSDGTQIIRIAVGGRIERVIMLTNKVNNGEFELSRHSPTAIRLTKTDQIYLELI